METSVAARGRFLWYDLVTNDLPAAHGFYNSVVGWNTQPFGEDYIMWVADGAPVGGSMDAKNIEGNPPPHWLVFIGTDDIDSTLTDVEARGGKVVSPAQELPEVGRWALCQDPQGAFFMAFEPASAAEPSASSFGHMVWNELSTSDPAAALGFYRGLFGWTEHDAIDMGPDGLYQLFGGADGPTGGVFPIGEQPIPPSWTPYVHVRDIDTAVESVRDGGGTVMHGPIEVPTGDRVAVCADPQGAVFGMSQSPVSDGR